MTQRAAPISRPLVAIIANVQTPYRLHLHRRIVREFSEIRLATLFTHDQPDQPWSVRMDPEINPVAFGAGHGANDQSRWRYAARDWRKGGRINRWLREQGAAAVVICGYNDLTRLRVIAACRQRGLPCFLFADSNIRGDGARGLKAFIKSRFVRWVVRSCTGLMPCGRLGAEYFIKYGARPERIFLHPYEPDYELARQIDPSRVREAAGRHALATGRRRIVVCSRLVSWKRIDLAIDAFAAIAQERPEWDLLVIGDGPERTALAQRVPDPIGARVLWTGFIGDQAEVSAIYHACDILLCPSDYEPWAVVVNEAAAAGLAIVASDVVGAAAELVVEGQNGAVFPAGDLEALIAALRRTTDPATIDLLKEGSAPVLADWRRRADPVDGLRQALEFAGVLTRRERNPSTDTTSSAAAPAGALTK